MPNPNFITNPKEKSVALSVLSKHIAAGDQLNDWSEIGELAEQHPDVRKQLRDVNPIWLLGEIALLDNITTAVLPPLSINFGKLKTFIPRDAISLDDGERVSEVRHYTGLDPETPFMSDSFALSTGNMAPRAIQAHHYHRSKSEVLFPMRPMWFTVIDEAGGEGESSLVMPGQYVMAGPHSYHTIVNPSDTYLPHVCLKAPEAVAYKDWHREPSQTPTVDYSIGDTRDGLEVIHSGMKVVVRLLSVQEMLPPSDFGRIAFVYNLDSGQQLSAAQEDFGSFIFMSPNNKTAMLASDMLPAYQNEVLVFERTA